LIQNLAVIQKSEKLAVMILDMFGTTPVNIQYNRFTRNNKNEFPLYLSIKYKLPKLAMTLLAAGADPNLKTKDGDDCVSLAEKTGQLDLIAELVKGGAKLRPVSASTTSGSRFRQLKGF
jgi:ankyrin repeat protein